MEDQDLVVLVAVLAGLCGAVLVVLVLVFAIKRCYGGAAGQKKMADLQLELLDPCCVTRSAPSTRNSSPRTKKKLFDSESPVVDSTRRKSKAMLMRSVTVDMIPDFSIPAAGSGERVQPAARDEEKPSLQRQQTVIGNLDTTMYNLGGSLDDDNEVLPKSEAGRLWFSLVYDPCLEELRVTLIKAKQLPPRKNNALRDPFVKLYLLPDERVSHESKVRRKTLTPRFDETFVFKVPLPEVGHRTLRMSVYDVDKRRVRHSLGHVLLPLQDVDLTKDETVWHDLESRSQAGVTLGEVNMSLTHIPNTEKIKLVVLRARNLRHLDYDSGVGVYVRLQQLADGRPVKTKRTATLKGTWDPVYNESFTFSTQGREPDSFTITATLMVSGTSMIRGQDLEYGVVTMGAGSESDQWQTMLSQPRTAVSRWLPLTAPPTVHTEG